MCPAAGLGLIALGAAKGLLIGAAIGGIIGGIASKAAGKSFWKGFEDGAFSGAITGAIFGGIGGAGELAGQVLGKSCEFITKFGPAIKNITFSANMINLGMAGFDLVSLVAMMIDPKCKLVQFNQMLHSSKLYNGAQLAFGAIGAFGSGMQKGIKFDIDNGLSKCFIAGTLISTASGLMAIENIRSGDLVLSADVKTGEVGFKKVVETYVRETMKLVHLTVNEEEIVTTEGHPFYVKEIGFVKAAELSEGDILVDSEGNEMPVQSVSTEVTNEPVKVYNFQVEEYHTYFVGNNTIFVHNAERYGNGHYEHNPSEDPKVLADAVEDPEAVYGYRPSSEGSLKNFADFDWSNPEAVEGYRQNRLQYIQDDMEILDMVSEMKNNGSTIEEMAEAACNQRNLTRLNSYLDSEGNIINQEGYQAALERMQTRSYAALIEGGKTPEQILESSMRTNPAMDACVGLYDNNYSTYTHIAK